MKLNYKIIGHGEPIVILHGLFGMLDNWFSFAKKLSKNYQIILVDQRNHGKSPHSDQISFKYYVNDLKELLDDLNIDQAHIMGHSMGGKTAMNFAISCPARTRSMISIDIGAHGYWKGNHDQIFNAILAIDLDAYSKRSEVDEALRENIGEINIRQFLLKNLNRTSNGFVWKANFKSLFNNYNKLREEVKSDNPFVGHSLFVRGSNSSYIKDEDYAYIKKVFPRAQIKTIHGAGHWVHAEKPAELLEVISDFWE